MRGYRKILIELKPEVSLQLYDLILRVAGRKIQVRVRNSQEPAKPTDGRIMPNVLEVLSQPLPPVARPGTGM